jgi:hypothetical protein
MEALSDESGCIARAAGSIVRKLITSLGKRPLLLAQCVHD